ncbi:MAG: hypothetical protein CMK29_01140 [Porticoccaceae bacterium]|nr:hypothetical protein [Porticoccaceae bacterium]|tara:strand:+ start:461 stop:742 length:282 start_codon:yes stop_codon:yes gene_type:complete
MTDEVEDAEFEEVEIPEPNIIIIDEKPYDSNALSPKAQYCLQQMQEISEKQEKLKYRLDRLQMSRNGFAQVLKDELPKEEEVKEDESETEDTG